MLGDRDTLDVPFEVRLGEPIAGLTVSMTDRPTEITGTVSDAAGRPTSEYYMFAFSTDRALWTLTWRGQVPLSSPDEEGRVVFTLDTPL